MIVDLELADSPAGLLLVHAEIEGEPVRFVLDTGASSTLVTPAVAARYRLAFLDETEAGLGAGGSLGELRFTSLRGLSLGGRPWANLRAAVVDIDHADLGVAGVLGHDVIGAGMLVDVPGGVVRLGAGVVAASGLTGEPSAPLRILVGGLPAVDVDVAGHVLPAVIDTGAAMCVLDLAAAAALGLDVARDRSARGADNRAMTRGVATVPTVTLAGRVARDVEVSIVDMPVFAALGLAPPGSPMGLVGMNVLGAGPVLLDLAGRRLYAAG